MHLRPLPRRPLVRVALLAIGIATLSSCTSSREVTIIQSFEQTALEKRTEITEYRATIERRGKSAMGDSLLWSLRRVTPDGKGASPMEEAVMRAKRRMELPFVLLSNQCLSFGDGIQILRSALVDEAMGEISGDKKNKTFAEGVIRGYMAMDPEVSSLMALAPADLLLLSNLKEGHRDSLLFGHPYYAGIPIAYSIDMRRKDNGIEGSAVLDSNWQDIAPEEMRRRLGHVGRFIRLAEGKALELTVIDTLILPSSFLAPEEKRICKRIYRSDLPLLP